MLSHRVEATLEPVVKRWAMQDKELLWPLFQEIVSGQSIWRPDLAAGLHKDVDDLKKGLSGSLAEVDSIGRVTELFGVTRQPTLHRIEVGRNTLFTCCALVAHIVPAIFGKAAKIVSTDPVSGTKVRVRISADQELQDVDPQGSYGSLVDCQTDGLLENPRTKFCCHVKHFTNAHSAAEFCGEDSRRYPLPIEEFHDAALQLFQRIWD